MAEKSRVNDITIDPNAPASRHELKQAEQDFAEFYHEQSQADLSVLLKQSRRRRGWLYLTSTLAILLALVLAGFFIFGTKSSGKFGEEAVQVNLNGPLTAPSGQEVEYVFNYKNDQDVDLNQLGLNLRYPTGFIFKSAVPSAQNADGNIFAVDKVKAHESGSVVVKGQLVGEVGEKKDFSGLFSYEPANFKAQFNKNVAFTTEIVTSVLNIDITNPDQLPIDQTLVLGITYKNSSTSKLTGALVKLTVPNGFELELPQLTPLVNSTNIWQLNDIEARGENKVELKGRFTSIATPGPQEFKLAIGLKSDKGEFTLQEEKIVNVNLVKSHLTLQLTANDVSLKSAVDFGQEITFEASFSNEGDTPFTNLTLIAKLNSTWFDWSSLKDDALGSVNQSVGTITWTKANLPLLETLQPGTRGSVRWRLQLVSSLPSGVNAPSFTAQVEAQGKALVNNNLENLTSQSNEVVTKINTQFSLAVEGRYYTDELIKLGSGPLPPRVGETTSYVIFWRLGNTLNEVENVEVTTTLPQGVNWTGQTTVTAGQKVIYNPNTREVRWVLNRLPAGAGKTFLKPEASFEVAVTPQESDADKILVLTKTTTATAHDTFSDADLISTAKFVTTELDDDMATQGKGVVTR
jgi:hypothetical protein